MMSPSVAIMFFLVLPAFMIIAGVVIYLYLRSLFGLVRHLEHEQPVLWHKLGSPRAGNMPAPGGGYPRGTLYYIKPFMPLFRWLLAGDFRDLDVTTTNSATRTRKLFFYGLVAFSLLMACTVIFIVLVESA